MNRSYTSLNFLQWCVAINNIDYIHHSIHPFVRALGLDKLINSLADFQNNVAAEHCKDTLELVMSNAVENVGHKIAELLEKLTSKVYSCTFFLFFCSLIYLLVGMVFTILSLLI